MLVPSHRHTVADLAAWRRLEAFDARLAHSPLMDRRIASAVDHIAEFASREPCYAGVSWGKDSVCVAGLVMQSGIDVPLVWVRVEPHKNPDCLDVRDAFLARFPHARYDEIIVDCARGKDGAYISKGRLEAGFKVASERYADRYISGIRSQESAARRAREKFHGVSTERTCAPITRWSGVDVFAYLHRANLPVHPAYACSLGGTLDRARLRVATLGGMRGTEYGRRELEWAYYRDELIALGLDMRVIDGRPA